MFLSPRLCVVIALAALYPVPAAAHPHAWIDTSEEIVFDAAGRVTAIRQHWLFDEFYTAETVKASGHGDNAEALVRRLLGNLKEWGYFTRVRQNGKSLVLAAPTEHSGRVEGHRLVMTFVVPLAEPVAVAGAPLSYAVYDPSFYIEMLHAETTEQVRLSGAPAGCRVRVIQPQPDPKAVALASSLDRTQSGGDGLGAFFAETVEVTCGPRD